MRFGSWQAWPEAPKLSAHALLETIDGGQTFRWQRTPDYLEGRWVRHVVRLRPGLHSGLDFAHPLGTDPDETRAALARYFALETNFTQLADRLPWRSDPILARAMSAFPGLRILRQPLAETLFSFLCSSTKQIPQIKAIHEAIAQKLGPRLPDGSHALPDWNTIAEAGEEALREVKLGYRARYIHQTACFLQNHPEWLAQIETTPTATARTLLCTLPGVGRKIADCVLLFAAGRLDAFPIDTWIEKMLIRQYHLDDWSLPQLQHFAHIHFAPAPGYAQQYLFSAARAGQLLGNYKLLEPTM